MISYCFRTKKNQLKIVKYHRDMIFVNVPSLLSIGLFAFVSSQSKGETPLIVLVPKIISSAPSIFEG